ncbi:MAG TPA: DUF2127 domain-containing protein [Clostridia bacterium]|nr:DUF2127 domain-containing protein [Clostridia bacterium]
MNRRKRKLDKNDIIHKSFEFGILMKAVDSTLEIIGGIFLIFLSPSRLDRLTKLLTQHELSEDPRDIIARSILGLSSKFTVSTQSFGAFYLISHGIIRMALVILLWKRNVWAYPITIISLFLFIFYQIHRYVLDHSVWLLVLTLFDMIMIFLTYREYKNIRGVSRVPPDKR